MTSLAIVTRRVAAVLVAVALWLGTSPVVAQEITGIGDARARFDPFSGLAAVATLSVSLAVSPDAGTVAVAVQPSNGAPWALRGQGPALVFQIRSPDGRTVASGTASAVVRADEGSETTVRFDVLIPGPQFAQAGLHEAELEVTLVDAAGAAVSPARFARLTIDVPVRAEANIAGASGVWGSMASVAFLDFGQLETGESLSAALQVRANTDVTITATSLNGGRLLNQTSPSAPGVAYTLSLDGVAGVLTGPLILQRRPPASLDGGNYPIRVTLGDVAGAYAGVYRDTLQIDVIGR